MVKALIGRKREMSQIFTEEGVVIPVTIVEAGPCAITQVKSSETKDGYSAYQLGFEDKAKNVAKPQAGHFKKAGVSPKRILREYRFEGAPEHEVGDTVTVEAFEVGDTVDVCGTSKGRGFQGGVRRHGFTVGRRSHGGKFIRHGSTGMNTTPGRVFKGKKMPGHMGVDRVTTRNLEVVHIDAERNLLYIKGAVPGHNNADVFVRTAIAGSRRKRLKA